MLNESRWRRLRLVPGVMVGDTLQLLHRPPPATAVADVFHRSITFQAARVYRLVGLWTNFVLISHWLVLAADSSIS